MSASIFINYRRDEASSIAGRLYDRLKRDLARRTIFMDVDAMKPGLDFARQLDEQIANCAVVLALIGPNWLQARDGDGRRRLDDPNDWVRTELVSALERDIPLMPVLLDGARMPRESELPDALKPLARRHAVELRHTRFGADVETIVRALKDLLRGQRSYRAPMVAAVATLTVLVGVAAWGLLHLQPTRGPSQGASMSRATGDQQGSRKPAAVRKETAESTQAASRRAGLLGVKIQDLTDEQKKALDVTSGAAVNEVSPHAAAAKAGLQSSDVIVSINDTKIASSRQLSTLVARLGEGQSARIEIARPTVAQGGRKTEKVHLPDLPDDHPLNEFFKNLPKTTKLVVDAVLDGRPPIAADLGLELGDRVSGNGDEVGVAIKAVASVSDAADKGLKPKHVILEVQQEKVTSEQDVLRILEEAQRLGRGAVVLRVRMEQDIRMVPVKMLAEVAWTDEDLKLSVKSDRLP